MPLPMTDKAFNPTDDQATRLRALVEESARSGWDRRSTDEPVAPPAVDATHVRPEGRRPRIEQPVTVTRARPTVLAIASGKGGVGKTSTAVNLSVALSHLGRRVTLLDGDIGLSNADMLCGVDAPYALTQALDGVRPLRDVLVEAPGGFRLASGGAGITRARLRAAADRHTIVRRLEGLESDTDLVLIDCGAGIGEQVLSFMASADLRMVVTTPEPTAIADAYALLKVVLKAPQSNRVHSAPMLLVNQASDGAEAALVHRRIAGVCRRFLSAEPHLVGWIPVDPCVRQAVRDRRPFMLGRPRSRASKATKTLAVQIARRAHLPESDRGDAGFVSRLFGLR